MTELKRRIRRSQKAIKSYPQWVRKSMLFHGGGIFRDNSERTK